VAFLERHERGDGLALEVVVRPTTAASATAGWSTSALSTSIGADPVAGDVEHVVHAAEDPEVPVLIELGAVPGEVHVGHLDQ
jgi:hypothetical protein